MTKEAFKALVSEGLVLLDGAMGSNLFEAGMPRGVCTEAWALEHPDVIENLQRAYVEAGSQILYAPTFGCNRENLSKYGLDSNVEEMNERLVAITKRAAAGKALVAGDMAPTGIILDEDDDDGESDRIFEIYREQAQALVNAGVDLIVIETMLSLGETEIALDAVHSVCDLPVICTLTYEPTGYSFYGALCTDAVEALEELGADAVGLNCSAGPDLLENVVRLMKESVKEIPIIAKPNAGMPEISDDGMAVYSMTPQEFGQHMKKLVAAGASVVGGCCGTTPDFIARLKMIKDGKLL